MSGTSTHRLRADKSSVPLPCFFPSISSVKTNLMPVDYLELLVASGHPLFLVSAYDIGNAAAAHRERMLAALQQCCEGDRVILMDSGNYERFWRDDPDWTVERLHEVTASGLHQFCFCFDNQQPANSPEAVADDVVASVVRDQAHSRATVIPIVHGNRELLPYAASMVASRLHPLMLAVPERALGHGIVERTRTVRGIRSALDDVGFHCPLHLLGTGNPLSIAAYSLAGANSFDGLEWCQTVVDHSTGHLHHFQHWDLFRHQTEWGTDDALPYVQAVLMHNLGFYRRFMEELRESIAQDCASGILGRFVPEEQAVLLVSAAKGV